MQSDEPVTQQLLLKKKKKIRVLKIHIKPDY